MRRFRTSYLLLISIAIPLIGLAAISRMVEPAEAQGDPGVISIITANSAPILQPTQPLKLANIPEDSLDPPGNTVEEILISGEEDPITDPDPDALVGIAVTGVEDSNGVWQYSLNPPVAGEFDWQPFGVISDTQAVLLRDIDWIRFVPAPDFFGLAGSITFRAWDRTSGTAGQREVDTSVNGGETAFSENTATASITVDPANDVPVLGGLPISPLTFVEGGPPLLLLGDAFTVTDSDSPLLASARVVLTNPLDENGEILEVDTGETAITATYVDGVLDLVGAASPSDYQAVMRTILYSNTSSDPTVDILRIFNVTVSDNIGSSLTGVVVVQIEPANNPPDLDLSGTGGTGNFSTVFFINRGPVLIVSPNLLLTDGDNTTIRSATIRITNLRNQQAEILNARLEGNPTIKRTYDVETGVLSLTGVDSIANYQKVLRTVTYNNTLPQPNRENRIVEFTVNDGLNDSETRTTTVAFQDAPPVFFFLPVVNRRSEEPNNNCATALEIFPNRPESFFANDRDDWFYFDLVQEADVTVELRDFNPAIGQIVVASGQGCSNLQLIGNNGNNQPDKDVALGRRTPGRFFVWLINDGVFDNTTPYRLLIRATP
jgi:hypothetical protein